MSRFLLLAAALLFSAPLVSAQSSASPTSSSPTMSLISDRTEFNGTWQAIGTRLLVSGADSVDVVTAYALQLRLTVDDLGEPVLEGGEQRILRMPANAFGMAAPAQTSTQTLNVSGALAPEAGQSVLTLLSTDGNGYPATYEAQMTSASRLVLTPSDPASLLAPLVYRRVEGLAKY